MAVIRCRANKKLIAPLLVTFAIFGLIKLSSIHTMVDRRAPDMAPLEEQRAAPLEGQRTAPLEVRHARTAPRFMSFGVPDRFALSFDMFGMMYDEKGPSSDVTVRMHSSLIHSFSPYTERRFREMVLDPPHEQRIYANSPAMLWLPADGKERSNGSHLLVVMRMWLEKEKYRGDGEKKMRPPRNEFSDNYLYEQVFDRDFRPLTSGRVLGLPTPTQWYIGDGPIEPRLISVGNRTFMTFNTGAVLADGRSVDSTFAWDYDRSRLFIPKIRGGAPMEKHTAKDSGMARDKHWAAFEDGGRLYFTYNLDPLRVLRCDMEFECDFVWFEGPKNYTFKQLRDHLRGGTPWTLYRYPYYISVAHGTFFKQTTWKRYYTTNLMVMSVHPTYRIVYSSSTVQVHGDVFAGVPIVRFIYIQDPFLFPVSVVLENEDTLAIGLHVNDHSSVAIRLRGLKPLMVKVIELDESRGAQQPERRGPPPGVLHNATKYMAERQSKYKLAHED